MLKRSYSRFQVPPAKSPSCGLQCVQLKQVVIGWGSKIKLVPRRAVVTRAVQSQSSFKVQKLSHKVKIGGNVGLFSFHKIVGVIQRQIELLH